MKVYSLYHCNLMFSSIEEEWREDVIKQCYWPILKIAEQGHKFSIEATVVTLEIIAKSDPEWVLKLKELIILGKIEFIGSGYSQIIGPAVPYEINFNNFNLGQKGYKDILGISPDVYLVNEMTFSVDLIEIYLECGIHTIITDWNNFCKNTRGVQLDHRSKPIRLKDEFGNIINVVWSDSILFQKFQRYVHGEYSKKYYLDFLDKTIPEYEYFPLYTSDAEVFGYRPGRYKTENAINEDEWETITQIYDYVKTNFSEVFISELENEEAPIVKFNSFFPVQVKKQDKYNLYRWTVNGRNNLAINRRCFQILENFRVNKIVDDGNWKELLYLWSSDFRTHTTENRYLKFVEQLNGMKTSVNSVEVKDPDEQANLSYSEYDHFIDLKSEEIHLILNKRKGLSIEFFRGKNSDVPLIGHVDHGVYDDISYGSDFFSGYSVCYDQMNRQYASLDRVDFSIHSNFDHIEVKSSSSIQDTLEIGESIKFFNDKIVLWKHLTFKSDDIKVIHPFFFSFIPQNLELETLAFSTQSGGKRFRKYTFDGYDNISRRTHYMSVSAQQGFLPSDGNLEIYSGSNKITFTSDNSTSPLLAGFEFIKSIGVFKKRPILWLTYSAQEYDDTLKLSESRPKNLECQLTIK